jgi:virulence-associated protein VagC
MIIAEVVEVVGGQMVILPQEFHLDADTVSVRREGDALVLEPMKPSTWPEGFFEAIRIDDPNFVRPAQGQMPPVPSLG